MRKVTIVIAMALLSAVAATAFAAGKLPLDRNRATVQNLAGIAPAPASSACTTATVTKGTLSTVTTTGFVGMEWVVTDAAGAPVVVKRYLGSNTDFLPKSGGTLVNAGGNTFASVAFKPYSALPRALTECHDLQ